MRRLLLSFAALLVLLGGGTAIWLTAASSTSGNGKNSAMPATTPSDDATVPAPAGVAGVQAGRPAASTPAAPPAAPAGTSTFALAVVNDNVHVTAGSAGAFSVAITRTNFPGTISFSASGAPAGAIVTFTPVSTTGDSTSLAVSTSAAVKQGSYTLTITGSSGGRSSTTQAHLTVSAGNSGGSTSPGHAFTLTGALDRQLAPGVTGYLDMAIANTNNQTMRVTGISVTVTGTNKQACATSNFATAAFSGDPFTISAKTTRTLSQLGIPHAQWPSVTMVNLSTNQDACKNVSLSLAFTATGEGN